MAEKLWNNAKFSIKETCKVTAVHGVCAKRPVLILRGGWGEVENGGSNRYADSKKEEEEAWATVQPIWDALHRQRVPGVTDKADPIFIECLKVLGEKMTFSAEEKKDASILVEILNQSKGPQKNKRVDSEILIFSLFTRL